jgi:hypothetical protein
MRCSDEDCVCARAYVRLTSGGVPTPSLSLQVRGAEFAGDGTERDLGSLNVRNGVVCGTLRRVAMQHSNYVLLGSMFRLATLSAGEETRGEVPLSRNCRWTLHNTDLSGIRLEHSSAATAFPLQNP